MIDFEMNLNPLKIMCTETLLERLQLQTIRGIKRNKREAFKRDEERKAQKREKDMLEAEDIIRRLPEDLHTAAKDGKNSLEIKSNIDGFHPDAVYKIKTFLSEQGLGHFEKPEFDPGTDSNWTELWASW